MVGEINRLNLRVIDYHKCTSYGALMDEFYKKMVRPKIRQPIFLTHYPVDMIPLAKRNEVDQRKINSFQLVVNGWELVKAYDELNDPIDQRARLEEQQEMLSQGEKEAHPMDKDFVEMMEYGLPPMAGFGFRP